MTNTDNPHIHLVIKGTEPNGKDLIIKPDYISHGMRFRSSDLLTRELGPRSELSIAKAKHKALLQILLKLNLTIILASIQKIKMLRSTTKKI